MRILAMFIFAILLSLTAQAADSISVTIDGQDYQCVGTSSSIGSDGNKCRCANPEYRYRAGDFYYFTVNIYKNGNRISESEASVRLTENSDSSDPEVIRQAISYCELGLPTVSSCYE